MATDPLRVLGLPPGASAADIKLAYRTLAKANHPDSAGESALPMFLAIQAAYEQLVSAKGRGTDRSHAGSPPADTWRADPARAREARGGTAQPGARTSKGEQTSKGEHASTGRTRRRSAKKATFGSTTYDEVHDPSDPVWQGAAWYGPSSGEYWTVNAREYADPRKHGPEYQARAAARDARTQARSSQARSTQTRTAEPRTAESRSDETVRARAAAAPVRQPWDEARVDDADPGPGAPAAPAPVPFMAFHWSRLERSRFRRLALALLAWPPLGIAAASLIGQATGCAVFSASCTGQLSLLPWVAQGLILLALVIVPFVARLLVAGTMAVVVLAFPAAAALSASGANYDRTYGPAALLGVLALAWLAGVAMMFFRTIRMRSAA